MSEREDYRSKLDSLVASWNSEFDELDAQIRTTADPVGDYDEVIAELRRYRPMAMPQH